RECHAKDPHHYAAPSVISSGTCSEGNLVRLRPETGRRKLGGRPEDLVLGGTWLPGEALIRTSGRHARKGGLQGRTRRVQDADGVHRDLWPGQACHRHPWRV